MHMLRLASGRFEILRQVGEGGAGVVFEGRDVTTDSPVAIKLLHGGNEIAQERFETEIAVLAELPHPAIVRYIDHGLADDGRQYLVMEWLAGKTVDEHRAGQWPVTEVLTLARRLVSGLAFAALRGVSHRDATARILHHCGVWTSRLHSHLRTIELVPSLNTRPR